MIKLHEAIRELNPSVTIIRGNIAYDENGNEVSYDLDAVQAYIDANDYQRKRAAEYPSIADQLDTLYHGGLTEWKATIKAVKDKYPKE
jgi:predicted lipoprotein